MTPHSTKRAPRALCCLLLIGASAPRAAWGAPHADEEREREEIAERALEVTEEELPALAEKARRGDARAALVLGKKYSDGLGVAKDPAKAFEWYRKAATAGSARGQYMTGELLRLGEGCAQNPTEAVRWFRKAADRYGWAQLALALALAKGAGTRQSDAEAVRWLRKAATSGNPYAQDALGARHVEGKGVEADEAKALEWYVKAIAQDVKDHATWAIVTAAELGDVKSMNALFDAGVAPSLAFSNGYSPLHAAAGKGRPEAARLLLERGVEVDARNEDQLTPLYMAAAIGAVPAAKLLLERGANVNAGNVKEQTPLHVAAENGWLDMVKVLVEAGADVLASDLAEATPAYRAERAGKAEVFQYLDAAQVRAQEKLVRTELGTGTATFRYVGSGPPLVCDIVSTVEKNLFGNPLVRSALSLKPDHYLPNAPFVEGDVLRCRRAR